MDDGMLVDVIRGSHDAIFEFLFGCDADVPQDGAGKFREEAVDQVQPGAVLGRESEFEAAPRLLGEPARPGRSSGRYAIFTPRSCPGLACSFEQIVR